MPSCGVRMSVRLSRSWILSKRILKHIFKIFLPSGNHTILIFPYQALWQYYDGDPLTGAKIAIFYQYFALRWLLERQARLSRSAAAFLYHADGRRCQHQWILFHQAWTLFLSVDGYMPETTEQNLIVRIGESEAEVTNNIRLRSRYCTVEANYRQTRSIARPVCGSKATLVSCTYHAHQFIFSFTLYFLFILCGRLSCLYSAILPHVKYTLSYHIVSYCIVLYCIKQLMAFVWWRLFGRRLSGGGGVNIRIPHTSVAVCSSSAVARQHFMYAGLFRHLKDEHGDISPPPISLTSECQSHPDLFPSNACHPRSMFNFLSLMKRHGADTEAPDSFCVSVAPLNVTQTRCIARRRTTKCLRNAYNI